MSSTPFQSRKDMEIALKTGIGMEVLDDPYFDAIWIWKNGHGWHCDVNQHGEWSYERFDTLEELLEEHEEYWIERYGVDYWKAFGWH